jgi:hypothetical protein
MLNWAEDKRPKSLHLFPGDRQEDPGTLSHVSYDIPWIPRRMFLDAVPCFASTRPPARAPAEVVNRCTRHQRQLTRCAAQWTERTKARGHRVAETWRPGSVTCWSAKAQGSKTVCTTETSETFQIKDFTFENNWTYLTCLIDEQFFLIA